MSERQEKRKRHDLRRAYQNALASWRRCEPARWRIFAHRKWKKSKPKCDAYGGLMK